MILALLLAVACPHPHRSQAPVEQFKKIHPCPEKCRVYVKEGGKFKLYRKCGRCAVDHVCALACCGKDVAARRYREAVARDAPFLELVQLRLDCERAADLSTRILHPKPPSC
jgi:hypothetical protein